MLEGDPRLVEALFLCEVRLPRTLLLACAVDPWVAGF
jgi:hypothetical protein